MNYTDLNAAIADVIKTNGREEITGQILQDILIGMVSALGYGYTFSGVLNAESEKRETDAKVFYVAGPGSYPNFEMTVPAGHLAFVFYSTDWAYVTISLVTIINNLTTGGADAVLSAEQGTVLKGLIDSLGTNLGQAIDGLSRDVNALGHDMDTAERNIESLQSGLQSAENAIGAIEQLIPNQASPSNKLADKDFVNHSVATNTANYISNNGVPFTSLAELEAYSGPLTNNDYAFVVSTDQAGNTVYTRYKYNADTETWAEEYAFDNIAFTAAQWNAINSQITAALVSKLAALPTKAELDAAFAGKQNVIDAQHKLDYSLLDNTPTIPDEVEANPAVPSGTTPTALEGLKIGDGYYSIEGSDPNAVLFTPQTLTDPQKEQARTNIGAGDVNKDGIYPNLVAGNLQGEPIPVTAGYTRKATAYDPAQPEMEVANGPVPLNAIQGRAVAWNQLISNPDFQESTLLWQAGGYQSLISIVSGKLVVESTRTSGIWLYYPVLIPANHKVLLLTKANGDKSVTLTFRLMSQYNTVSNVNLGQVGNDVSFLGGINSLREYVNRIDLYTTGTLEVGDKFYFDYFNLIDLTIMFGAGNEPTTVAEFEEKLTSLTTLKPYYPQNAGQLVGARMLGWQLRGTDNLLNPTTKRAELVEYAYTGHDNEYTVNGWDELTNAALQFTPYNTGVAEAVTLDANNRFVIPSAGILEVVPDGGDITGDVSRVSVIMTYDTSHDGEVEAFSENSHDFDSANIYHKSGDVYTQVFDGGVMRATGDGADAIRDAIGFDTLSGKCWTKKMVGEYIFVGTEDYIIPSDTYLHANTSDAYFLTTRIIGGNLALCNRLPRVMASWAGDNDGITLNRFSDIQYQVHLNLLNAWTGIVYGTDNRSTALTKIKAYIAAQYQNGTPLKMWYPLYTPIIYTSDLYYKTGDDTYVPLEEVFPINGIGNNWATENLIEQGFDANNQPQSITPITTEVFQSDMRELLKTIGDTYTSREQAKSDMDALLSAMATYSRTALGGVYTTDGYKADGTIKIIFTAD